jgi:hypothetical protein
LGFAMRHFILGAFVSAGLFFPTFPAAADATACLADPDRTCIFALAKAAALAEERLDRLSDGFVAVAVAQEKLGQDEALATFRELLDLLATRAPDPSQQFDALKWHFGLTEAPKVAALLADAVAAIPLEDIRERRREEVRLRAYAGEVAAIRTLIDGLEPHDRFSLVLEAAKGFMRKGDFATAFDLRVLITDGPILDRLAYSAVDQLLADGELAGAEVAAAMIDDPGVRADALALVARELASRGQPAAVRRLDALIEGLASHSTADALPIRRAEALIQIGERDRAVSLVEKLPRDEFLADQIDQFNLTVTLFDGDIEAFLQAAQKNKDFGGLHVYGAFDSWLRTKPDDVELVLDQLPQDLVEYALRARNGLLMHTDDWDELAASLERYPGEDGVFDRERVALAMSRARNGDIMGALPTIVELGTASDLAAIAVLLPQ